jgi:peptidyl-dipeptidase A
MQAFPHPILTCLTISACSAILAGQTPPPSQSPLPTVQEAQTFIERVNAALLASSIENSRTAWVARTYITDDTEILTAAASSRAIAQRNQFIAESHHFDSITLPPDLTRQMRLIRSNAHHDT